MWTALALVGVLAAANGYSDQLTISNVRLTRGLLGPEREDSKVMAGDSYFIAFDIEGLKTDDTGRVRYNLAMEATDSRGNVVYTQKPRDMEATNSLGGSRVPAFSFLDVGPSVAPGEYTMKVTATDRTTKASQQLVRKFEILPREFGIVRLQITLDTTMQFPTAALGVPGQSLWVHFSTIGFQRDPANKQPDLQVQMRILDESGQPTVPKPITAEVNDDVSENLPAVPWHLLVFLNRPGKYTMNVQATDRVSKKTAKLSFPLRVVDVKASVPSR
jgi:hypothetical protein